MSTRDAIFDATHALVVQHRTLPSLDAVAAAAGLSKGGLIHHVRTRAALVEGLVEREIERVDRAMTAAAGRGEAARTWLLLSAPEGDSLELYRCLDVLVTALAGGSGSLPERLASAMARWDALLLAELGDLDRALLVRVVGDGLLLNAVNGTPLDPEQRQRLTSLVLAPQR